MRNLKKILALVLALVMSLSLMATAGAAETTSADSAANAYATAAEVLQGLKVLEGYPDGDMHYEDHLTRAHAAAVFYRVDTKDVDNKNKDLYTNAPFSDVAADHWGRGYIAYCYDNKIIKGMGDGTFGDKSPLTGYQVLVMALRELGYGQNNEFDGDNYQIKTASTATQIGMLKGVTPIDQNRLGEPATRGLMAQIVFNMLLQDTVRYNALYQTYESDGKGTLGEQKFDLEEVEGVIVANEYAGIERGAKSAVYGTALSEGQTALRDDEGNIYEVNYSTKLEDLGLTRVVYTIKQAARDNYKLACLSMDDPDNDKIVYEDGKKVDNITKTAVNVDANTERYINFGETSGTTTTKIKVTYQFTRVTKEYNRLNASLAATAFRNEFKLHTTVPLTVEEVSSGRYRVTYRPNITDRFTGNVVRLTGDHTYSIVESPVGSQTYHYRVEIEPKAEFNAFDKEMVYGIFRRADLLPVIDQPINTVVITGEVFRGTQSVTDYSDAHSYEQFEVDCLTLGKEHDNSLINSNSLGWWLKIIDNDKDGYADWIFQTRYTVAEVIKKAEDGTLTLDTQTASWATEADDGVNSGATSAKSYPGETIEAGDVVYYATIDGANWAWKCEEVPGKVDVVNRNDLTVKLVGNDTVYTQSAVHEHTASEDILSGVINMSGTTNVKLYLDKYDNMAAFAQDISGKFALLTDGWRQTTKNGADYAVKVWDQETKSIKQYDVTEGGARFIGNADTDIDANSWNRIRQFQGLNDGFYTYATTAAPVDVFTPDTTIGANTATRRVRTMVAYMETDGETARLLPVDTVYDVNRINDRGYRMIDMNQTIPLQATVNTGVIYRTTNASDILQAYDTPARSGGFLDDSTRVRALSSTTYYFVYHTTWNASTTVVDSQGRSIYVDEVKGFAAANQYILANNVVTDRVNHIEDVYVVGREARDVVVTNDDGSTTANAAAQNNVYYTADVVVVELDASYYGHNHNVEEVFIYDFPEVITNDRYENVKAIRADGRNDENLKIDLGLSRTYTEANGKFTNEAVTTFRPGLYWLHRSYQTNSEDIWFIDPMTHAEIRAAGHYDAGTVDTATFTNSNNYAEIRDWVCKGGNIATADAVSIVAHNEALAAHAAARPIGSTDIRDPDRNPFALNAANNIRSDAENSKYYKLSYATATGGKATMTSTGIKDCLGREVVGTNYDGLNQVLVRWATNRATGEDEIVYAVSFNHDPYAQQIWRSVLKNPDVGVLRLTFILGAGNSVTISDVTTRTAVRECYTVSAMPATVTNTGVVKVLIRDRSASGRGYSDDITFRMTFNSAAAVPVAGVTDGRWTIFSVTNVVGNTYDIVLRPNAGVQVLSALSDYVGDANAVFTTEAGLVDLAEDILKNPTSYTSTTLGYDLKSRLATIVENRETPGKYDDDKVWLGDKVELPAEDLETVQQAVSKLPSVKDPTPSEPDTPDTPPAGKVNLTFKLSNATVEITAPEALAQKLEAGKTLQVDEGTTGITFTVTAADGYENPTASVTSGTTTISGTGPYTLGAVNAATEVTASATKKASEGDKITVSFYGVEVAKAADDATDGSITVSYATAKAYTGGAAVKVTGADSFTLLKVGKPITVADIALSEDEDAVYTLRYINADGVEVTFTLTQSGISADLGELISIDPRYAKVTYNSSFNPDNPLNTGNCDFNIDFSTQGAAMEVGLLKEVLACKDGCEIVSISAYKTGLSNFVTPENETAYKVSETAEISTAKYLKITVKNTDGQEGVIWAEVQNTSATLDTITVTIADAKIKPYFQWVEGGKSIPVKTTTSGDTITATVGKWQTIEYVVEGANGILTAKTTVGDRLFNTFSATSAHLFGAYSATSGSETGTTQHYYQNATRTTAAVNGGADYTISFGTSADMKAITLKADSSLNATNAKLPDVTETIIAGSSSVEAEFKITLIDKVGDVDMNPVVTIEPATQAYTIVRGTPKKIPTGAAVDNAHEWTLTVESANSVTVTVGLEAITEQVKPGEIGEGDANVPSDGVPYKTAYERVGIDVDYKKGSVIDITINDEQFSSVTSDTDEGGHKTSTNIDKALITMRKHGEAGADTDYKLYVGVRFDAPVGTVKAKWSAVQTTDVPSTVPGSAKALSGDGLNLYFDVAEGSEDGTHKGTNKCGLKDIRNTVGTSQKWFIYIQFYADDGCTQTIGPVFRYEVNLTTKY